jgi:DNA-binding transcriptional LysR family regulator
VKPSDVWDQTLLTYDRAVNPTFYDSFMSALQQAGYRFPRRHETEPDPRNTFLGVEYGLGVAIAPRSFETRNLLANYGVIAIPLDPPLSYPTTIVAWRADPPRRLAERLDAIRKAASELFRSTALQVEPT